MPVQNCNGALLREDARMEGNARSWLFSEAEGVYLALVKADWIILRSSGHPNVANDTGGHG
jgi:hypothetical protein